MSEVHQFQPNSSKNPDELPVNGLTHLQTKESIKKDILSLFLYIVLFILALFVPILFFKFENKVYQQASSFVYSIYNLILFLFLLKKSGIVSGLFGKKFAVLWIPIVCGLFVNAIGYIFHQPILAGTVVSAVLVFFGQVILFYLLFHFLLSKDLAPKSKFFLLRFFGCVCIPLGLTCIWILGWMFLTILFGFRLMFS